MGDGKEYLNFPPSVCELKAISSIKFIFRIRTDKADYKTAKYLQALGGPPGKVPPI
jgi:hypothetical protein